MKDTQLKVPAPYDDETLVTVITNLGLYCGAFVWPTEHLEVLADANNIPMKGNYFRWKKMEKKQYG